MTMHQSESDTGRRPGPGTTPPVPPARSGGRRWGLVLGGGGVLGAAWMSGALTALEQVHGLDARDADVILGTSAGSVIGALLAAGVPTDDIRRRQSGQSVGADAASVEWEQDALDTLPPRPRLAPGSSRFVAANARRLRTFPPTTVLAAMAPQGRGSIASVGRLVDRVVVPGQWTPHPGFRAVTLDYDTGRRVVFGDPGSPTSGAAEAVMASCAIPGWYTPITIGGRRYVDGGTWSATNVDLMVGRGLSEVFVLAPMASFAPDAPDQWQVRLERAWRERVTRRCLREVSRLHRDGVEVTVIGPGARDLRLIGGNLMDGSRAAEVVATAVETSFDALSHPLPIPSAGRPMLTGRRY